MFLDYVKIFWKIFTFLRNFALNVITPIDILNVMTYNADNESGKEVRKMVGKGQPPKKQEEKRKHYSFRIYENEMKQIEEGRAIESPEKGTSAYIRDAALEKAKKAIENKK